MGSTMKRQLKPTRHVTTGRDRDGDKDEDKDGDGDREIMSNHLYDQFTEWNDEKADQIYRQQLEKEKKQERRENLHLTHNDDNNNNNINDDIIVLNKINSQAVKNRRPKKETYRKVERKSASHTRNRR